MIQKLRLNEKEATAVREFLKKKHPVSDGHPYLLVGDFNDTPNPSL